MKRAVHATVGVAILLGHALALADEIRINRRDCASGVHLVVRNAHLSEVLKRLAQTLDFKLRYQSESDPLISVDTALQPSALVAVVAQPVNFTMIQARSQHCPDEQRILELAVLPDGKGIGRQLASAPLPTPTVQETPEQARQAQEGIDLYLKSHGFQPDKRKKAEGD